MSVDVAWAPAPACGLVHFSASVYLDARRPEWAALEAAGVIRYHVPLRWVLVAAEQREVIAAIRATLAEDHA